MKTNQALDSAYPYHVTSRRLNRDRFPVPIDEMWRICEDYLSFVAFAYDLKIHAFVLMPNHYHLVVSAPDGNLSEAMAYFNREVAREVNRLSGRINQCFGRRFFRSRIESDHYFNHAYKYTYRNPVKAGLAHRVEDYPYSTLHGLIGRSNLVIPIHEDSLVFDSPGFEATLRWLNEASAEEDWSRVRKAIRRKTFRLPRTRNRLDLLEFKAL